MNKISLIYNGVSKICRKRYLLMHQILNETRVAATDEGKLDDFEIESNKKNAVKGDVY